MHCEKNETKFPDFPINLRSDGHFFKANYESSTLTLNLTLRIGQPSTLGKELQLLYKKLKMNSLSVWIPQKSAVGGKRYFKIKLKISTCTIHVRSWPGRAP